MKRLTVTLRTFQTHDDVLLLVRQRLKLFGVSIGCIQKLHAIYCVDHEIQYVHHSDDLVVVVNFVDITDM